MKTINSSEIDYLKVIKNYENKMNNSEKLFFHVTTKPNWKSIKTQKMLKPEIGKRSNELGELKPRIYLFNNITDASDAVMNWLGDAFENTNFNYNDDNLDDNINALVIKLDKHDQYLEDLTKDKSSFESHYYNNIPISDVVFNITPF